ncbi:MAG: hypothetical protein PVI30_25255 [Myxococcales bacterium]
MARYLGPDAPQARYLGPDAPQGSNHAATTFRLSNLKSTKVSQPNRAPLYIALICAPLLGAALGFAAVSTL